MDIVIRKLELWSGLTAEEKRALRATFASVREFAPGQDILRAGEKPPFVGALLKGMLGRYKALPEGQRQIVSFPLAGDIFDLHSFTIDTMDHGVAAVSRAVVATASHAAVESMADAHPRLGRLLWRDAVVESSIFREWIVNCGRRAAYARISHLFCEIYCRLHDVGLASHGVCELPLTQADISDATGLSVVHVNRVLQQLRAEELITLAAGRLTIRDWKGLAEAGGFTSGYLHLREELPSAAGLGFRSAQAGPA